MLVSLSKGNNDTLSATSKARTYELVIPDRESALATDFLESLSLAEAPQAVETAPVPLVLALADTPISFNIESMCQRTQNSLANYVLSAPHLLVRLEPSLA
ncbi:unnamed protein product [Phytophthora lilii]|uniref:Unnamed protein product n=1 Tax=Phytophthora lilii TaxID=2077276 RepID=A0A9W6X948_9STRA|nr:unnamed protein product [Phytophthora lilii]